MRAFYRYSAYACACCVGFLLVNLALYIQSERVNSKQSNSKQTKQPSLLTNTVFGPEKYVIGLEDPTMLLETTLHYHDRHHIFPKALWPDAKNGGQSLFKQLEFVNLLETVIERTHPQMKLLPRERPDSRDKIILVASGLPMAPWDYQRERLIKDQCPITNCFIISSLSLLPDGLPRPDAVLFKGPMNDLKKASVGRTQDEVWIVNQLESPESASMGRFDSSILPNWTATFRTESTLVTPYNQFVPHSFQNTGTLFDVRKNYAFGKDKLVAWFVSNCKSHNRRLKYAEELQKYIPVDIYGACGSLKCPKMDDGCFKRLRDHYKFYLSFENSNCREYISEKFFNNALLNDVVPVVMGAHPDDYRKVAPPHSYIHVDDFDSPKELAEYLHMLHKNDTLYNEYFRWKGTGKFIDTKFWCRLCAMLHARERDNYVHWYKDIHKWWNQDACVSVDSKLGYASWRKHTPPVSAVKN